MAESMSINALATFRGCIVSGSKYEWRNLGQMKKSHTVLGIGRSCPCLYGGTAPSFGQFDLSRSGAWRVEAGWLFKGGEKRSDLDASCELSESANEDILMFFFELDLATRVQYALNLEQYDIAKQLRNKLTEVESEVIKLQENRRGSASKSEAQDMAISILRLRAELQNAIEHEKYNLAAELRDEISKLESESLAASVKARAYENAQYAFRLGQKLKHKIFGYLAVICGMDPVCCESRSWMDGANINKLTRGPDQPFYQVLVDVREDPNLFVAYGLSRSYIMAVTLYLILSFCSAVSLPGLIFKLYILTVPEENLVALDKQDMDTFDHPYASFLFYGMDAAGDFIPIKQLRDKYNQPRHELPYNPPDEENGKDA